MRFRTALCLATLFLVCFTVAAWSTPRPAQLLDYWQPPPDTQSMSGKISAVGDAAFSLEVTKNQEVKTVEFLVDGDTKVEGKLAPGANATVEYRSNSGKNVAVHVVVTPASGMGQQ
jgi:hypothetical protein